MNSPDQWAANRSHPAGSWWRIAYCSRRTRTRCPWTDRGRCRASRKPWARPRRGHRTCRPRQTVPADRRTTISGRLYIDPWNESCKLETSPEWQLWNYCKTRKNTLSWNVWRKRRGKRNANDNDDGTEYSNTGTGPYYFQFFGQWQGQFYS